MSSHEQQSLGWHPSGMVESAVLKCVGCCPLARGECDTWCPGVIPSTRGQPWLRIVISPVREVGEFTPLAPVLLQEFRRFVAAAEPTPSNENCWNGGVLDKRSMSLKINGWITILYMSVNKTTKSKHFTEEDPDDCFKFRSILAQLDLTECQSGQGGGTYTRYWIRIRWSV